METVKTSCFDTLRECSTSVRLIHISLQLLTKKCLLCLGQTKLRWLQLSLTQSQHPFSVTWEILDVGMEDGHRSWRWTATRYGVASVRFLDSRDIKASVWVFPTKSKAKIATDWDELASSVTTQKNAQNATISCSPGWKNDDLMENAGQNRRLQVPMQRLTSPNKTAGAKRSYSAFRSVQFIFI